MNFNKAFVLGNLTRDPEMRTTSSGKTVCTFSVATNRRWTGSSGEKQEETEFHNIVAWGRLAEICGQYLAKGRLVFVEGRLQTRSWEDQQGNRRYRTEIVARNMQMGPQPQGGGSRPQQRQQPPGQSSSTAGDQGGGADEVPTIDVDDTGDDDIDVKDIPF